MRRTSENSSSSRGNRLTEEVEDPHRLHGHGLGEVTHELALSDLPRGPLVNAFFAKFVSIFFPSCSYIKARVQSFFENDNFR